MNKIYQYTLILLVLTTIGGSVWYLNSTASTKVNSSQETKLADGLVGYWTFDGNHMDWSQSTAEARDQSGNNYHGNVIGSTSSIDGKVGQALNFNGNGDYVTLSSSMSSYNDFTVSAWVKMNSNATSQSNNYLWMQNAQNRIVMRSSGYYI
ncbi:hypothetical protein ACFLY1_00770, partial [Patescibacteria group bacterium]